MKDRESRIQEIKESMNTVEDRVFASFCASIGVENIRFVYQTFTVKLSVNQNVMHSECFK